ncbi:hypothetical protein [Hymenobacter volaticus]|uniref:DUF4390 domain-containing protein n=1 Tax=Hymenobacter volaticus TaxID=2932254 RepID=A0ABY4GCI6_9BACT|nr:hypothetical protein [Hymenobacter volaticus]UOQ68653.1 hypothetical protein MUN86_23300 [Hymenobacter volaticus]
MWKWLLRSVGLETWFQKTSVAAQAGQEERVFLRLTLPDALNTANTSSTTPLTEALSECLTTIRASGGQVVSNQGNSLLLSWPAELGALQVVPMYFQLRERVYRRARQPKLFAAASLGWVTARHKRTRLDYQGEVVKQVAGMLRENQQLGHDLLISAALYHRLDQTLPYHYELHVGFDLPGHRYPATLFRVRAELPVEQAHQSFPELATTAEEEASLPYL